MAIITWSDELSVGVKKFDDQHKVLIDHLNELHDAMRRGTSKEIMGKILRDLIAYTKTHFASEEEAFDAYGYLDAEEHKAQHKHFADKVQEMHDKFTQGKLFISVEVLNFMIDWVSKHIQGSDKKYTDFLKDKVE